MRVCPLSFCSFLETSIQNRHSVKKRPIYKPMTPGTALSPPKVQLSSAFHEFSTAPLEPPWLRPSSWHEEAHRRLGGAQTGNRSVSFVRSYARSGCLVELDLNVCGPPFSLFPFGLRELSLFPFGLGSFPLSLPAPPKPPIQL